MKKNKDKKDKFGDVVSNKVAYHNYEVIDTYEAGIKLVGTEVKSLRDGQGSLQDNYIDITKEEAFLCQSYIGHYKFGNIHNHEEKTQKKVITPQKGNLKTWQAKRRERIYLSCPFPCTLINMALSK